MVVHCSAFHYTIDMEPFHPRAADVDVPSEELALPQAECALALGRLDGLLAGLANDEKALFCMALLRAVLLTSLKQAGFIDTELRFNAWFAGLDRAPQESALTVCSATAVIRALLAELGHHPWKPLASAAQTIAAAARFGADRPAHAEEGLAEETGAQEVLAKAAGLAEQAGINDNTTLPFAGLARLNALLRADPLFAPVERAVKSFSLGDREVAIEQTAPRTPLWAVDAALGRLLSASGTWARPLPCPGAVTAEALQPQLWPGERALLTARSLHLSVTRICALADQARRRAALMGEQLGHLRSSARAPQVWTFLSAFAPLGLDQIGSAFRVSRRGTYAIGDALVAAGLARRETVKGKVLLVADEPRRDRLSPSLDQAPAIPRAAMVEFDAAMADIDRLLNGSSHQC
ncbi:hypothetical protein NUH86_24690 (plasmid) [Sphingobium sp. JS3065]|uniref:hypothetical protein n=1 Tax=Sphingobium sp. JS3065 TaxID=2970925 RepID=UPI00226451F0|nr:hypothetical protein [Sphingobium sp. JS3065]UZW58262.1 hypothetical protein NUH86_24690 [Sphingobium sp. JS3065]